MRRVVTPVLFPLLALVMSSPASSAEPVSPQPTDPHQWLEDVTGERQLEWVRARNAKVKAALTDSADFTRLEARLLSILDSRDRIPLVGKIGGHYYNFWRDGKNPKGLWRRTTLAEYRLREPHWETVVDLDALAVAEGENWVWHRSTVLEPDDRRCLVALSRGGADAEVIREFDLESRAFVADGFALPEAKSRVVWRDADTLLVGTDFGPGSLTTSGYPRTIRAWRRGTPLADAPLLFEGQADDMSVSAFVDRTPGFVRELVVRQMTFWTNELHQLRDGKLVRVPKPDDANASLHREWLLLELRSDWEVGGMTYPAGALLAIDHERFMAGDRAFHVVFRPGPRSSLVSFSPTRHHLLVTTLDNVRNRIEALSWQEGKWLREPVAGVPDVGTASATAVDDLEGDDFFLVTASPLAPSTLSLGTLPAAGPPRAAAVEKLKSAPAFFEADGLVVEQHEATSADGTQVPYFQIGPRKLPADGSTPTLLYGYGGFEIPLVPGYDPLTGAAWLERGHVSVIANIRGGGEFGPAWHQAALKANRPRAYEDFIAVAEDLVRRKVTSPAHLGIKGGSNGGLLMGNMLTRRPDLWGGIVCQVPLLDMRRYHTLLAGASWMGEYGNPDEPAEWEFIKGFSPYHNVDPAADYPPILITTSTRDDRVHPGHARKMAARLEEHGKPVLSYENVEGGHGGAADNRQKAFMDALGWTFLEKELR
ncbi:MAG: S9 family peptidase [Planctomycetia bacterium]|nr:S9 family peptidase [Planctomycetia bacterium]